MMSLKKTEEKGGLANINVSASVPSNTYCASIMSGCDCKRLTVSSDRHSQKDPGVKE